MRSPLIKVIVAVLALLILAVIAVPLFVNGEAFRPTLESRLSAALNRKVTIGHLSFSLFSGSLVAKDIAIADDPAFSTSPFLKANELKVGVEVRPLIARREIHITSLTIDTPAIQLIQNQAGRWNYSSIGNKTPRTPQQSSGTSELSVGELDIKNGSASVSAVPPTARPFAYTDVNVNVKQFAFENNFPFDLSATLPGSGSLKLNGTAGPISQKDTSETPVHTTLHVTHLDPVAAGLVDRSKGISAIADIDAHVDSNGATVTSSGKIKAANLQLSRAGSPAPSPVNIDYNISTDLKTRAGRVRDIAVHAGSAAAHASGTYHFTPQALILDLHVSAPNLPIDQLESLLPAIGVKVPAGSQLKGGVLTANLNVTGPATDATIAGPIQIDNTRLAGFDLGSRIQGLTALTGTAGGTDIQTLRGAVNSGPQGTQINDIYGNLPQIGTATGSGTVAPSGALNFNLVATLNNSNIVGAVANQAINQVADMIGGFLHPNAKPATSNTPRGIPLTVTGTSTSPAIRANVRALLQ